MHVAGVREDASTFEHLDPGLVGNSRELLISELSGKGTVQERAADSGLELDAQTAARIVDRVKELEHEGYHFEAADGSFDLLLRKETGDYEPLFRLESWRVIVEKRADGKVETEATIKIWVDGERYVRTAEGNGPVHALDQALRDAIGEIHPHLNDIELVNFKVRILDETKGTDAVTRVLLDASDGHEVWGSIGVSTNVIEASWEALVDSLEYGMQPGRRAARARDARAAVAVSDEPIPLAQPVIGEAEERAVLEVLRSGRLSLGPALPAFEEAFAARLGVAHASAVSSGTAGLHLALRAVGVSEGDEVVTSPFSFVASANAIVYERARPVFADIDPVTLNLDPQAAAAAVTDRTTALLPVHIFGYPADLPAFERMGLPIVEDACEALGARARRRRPGRRARAPGGVRLLRQQADHHRRGRDGHDRRPGGQGPHRLRAQPGPRAGHGLARPRPARLQLPALRHRLRARPGAARAPRRAARRPRARGRLVPRGAGGDRGPRAALRGPGRGAARLVRLRRPAAGGRRPRRDDRGAARPAGSRPSPYLPPIHLMSYYRDTFGHREGEFPVCEDVGARSVALPFFPRMTEGQVAQVAEALGEVLGRA